jgi:hypothetical protein
MVAISEFNYSPDSSFHWQWVLIEIYSFTAFSLDPVRYVVQLSTGVLKLADAKQDGPYLRLPVRAFATGNAQSFLF